MLEIIKDVKVIKTAILKSRYIAARLANGEMLKLYFAIGGYVSTNSRNGHWGTGAIDEISTILQKELPGLRGFSAQNMRNMRQFYEEWAPLSICQTLSSKMETSSDSPVSLSDKDLLEIRQPLADELGTGDASAFMNVGFSHHMAIIRACKSSDERLFYIRKAASDFWSYRVLLQHIRANDYATQGKAVNNFALTMPDDKQVSRAVQAFKSEYLLDFVNIVDAARDDVHAHEKASRYGRITLATRHRRAACQRRFLSTQRSSKASRRAATATSRPILFLYWKQSARVCSRP